MSFVFVASYELAVTLEVEQDDPTVYEMSLGDYAAPRLNWVLPPVLTEDDWTRMQAVVERDIEDDSSGPDEIEGLHWADIVYSEIPQGMGRTNWTRDLLDGAGGVVATIVVQRIELGVGA